MTFMSRRHFVVAAGAAGVAALTGCDRTGQKSAQEPLKAGYVKVLAALPFMYAHDSGLFKERGINLEVVEFANSNDVSLAGVSGSVDFVGAGATNASLDAMTAASKVMQMFTCNDYVKRPNLQSTDFLLALPEFTTPQALKGKTVAFFPGSFGKMFARLVLPKIGLAVEDVKYVEMQPPQWLAALQSGSVQAVTALEPVATKIMESMKVNVLVDGYYATVMQNVPASGSWFRQGHLDKEAETAVHAAMVKAIEILTNDRQAANAAIAKLFKLDPKIAEKVRLLDWHSTTQPGARQSLIDFAALLEREKGIARPVPANNSWIWA